MTGYRKIKLFKFSDFESYEACQESANDYWAELNGQNVDSEIVLNTDFIAVVLKNVKIFKIKGEDLVSAIKANVKVDPDRIITSQPIPVKP